MWSLTSLEEAAGSSPRSVLRMWGEPQIYCTDYLLSVCFTLRAIAPLAGGRKTWNCNDSFLCFSCWCWASSLSTDRDQSIWPWEENFTDTTASRGDACLCIPGCPSPEVSSSPHWVCLKKQREEKTPTPEKNLTVTGAWLPGSSWTKSYRWRAPGTLH